MYETAIRDDGSLLFPERLTPEFLDEAKRVLGSQMFANQYLNEVFPDGEASFKKEWFKYYSALPESVLYTFAFIDPAISQENNADYTGVTVVSVDHNTNWYIRKAYRRRYNPTEIVQLCFDLNREFNLTALGIEDVAYQKALLYMVDEEMKRRRVNIPVTGHKKPHGQSKPMLIRSMIPLFEWGRVWLTVECEDFQRELLQFPRGRHDDIADSCAMLKHIVFYPPKPQENWNDITNPNDIRYESRVIRDLVAKSRNQI